MERAAQLKAGLSRFRAGSARFSASALLPVAILAVVLLMVVPVPAILLDIFFVSNILLSLVMLMVVLQARRPLDFSTFPTVLLFATLFRLALNVASTRVVLVSGHEGTDAAGQVIEAFGKALIGGNFVVGLIVFSILMIINMAVIAKGAGRVSEVSARFTLDALPGKQMAIDADLNAGMLTPEEARARRQDVATEADFYGSMDGASKFVKGDAVAGLLILAINILGGLIIGMTSHGLGLGEAADLYLLLSVGDALVAQIPALLLSIAAAVLVTRTTEDKGLDQQLRQQFAGPAAWWPAAAILGVLSLAPSMPMAVLLPAAAVAGLVGWKLSRPATAGTASPATVAEPADPPLDWAEIGEAAAINLDIGYGLIALVEGASPLMPRITAIRRQISKELGFVVPMVRVRDDLALPPHAYRIGICGEAAGMGEAWPADLLALEADSVTSTIPGRETRDPVFGLNARWIMPEQEADAVAAGYTVVDPATVIGTHLHKLVKDRAPLLFGQDEAHALLETLGTRLPQLAQSIGPKAVPLATTASMCQALLGEGLSLREFPRIAAAYAQVLPRSQDPVELAELVREKIGGLIVATLLPDGGTLRLLALAPRLEALLAAAWRASPQAAFPFEPGLAARVAEAVKEAAAIHRADGGALALVSQPGPRRAISRLLKGIALPVLSFTELPDSCALEIVSVIGDEIAGAPSSDPEGY